MKNSSIKFLLLLALGVFIMSSCHKSKVNTIPAPAFDSTAYKDSIIHAQHIQDSVQRHNDSVAHYQDSLHSIIHHYFNKIIGTRSWDGHQFVYAPWGPYDHSFTDSLVTIKYLNPDSSAISIGTGTVFSEDSLKSITQDWLVFSNQLSGWETGSFTFVYYIANDSMTYSEYTQMGQGYGYDDWHTR